MTTTATTAAETITARQRSKLAGMATYCSACSTLASIVCDDMARLVAVCDACGMNERAKL